MVKILSFPAFSEFPHYIQLHKVNNSWPDLQGMFISLLKGTMTKKIQRVRLLNLPSNNQLHLVLRIIIGSSESHCLYVFKACNKCNKSQPWFCKDLEASLIISMNVVKISGLNQSYFHIACLMWCNQINVLIW